MKVDEVAIQRVLKTMTAQEVYDALQRPHPDTAPLTEEEWAIWWAGEQVVINADGTARYAKPGELAEE